MALKSGRVGIHPSQVDPITGMLIGGTGGASIDDTSVSTETTWSSNKINSELSGKQDELTAGSNITIQNNVISSTASGGLLPELQITATTGSTVTATKGTTVITATEISSGLFTCEVPEFGTYTVSDGTDSTTVTVDTVKIYEVEIIPTPSVISVTLTLYSATEDQVTVVDEDGTHLEQFASGQSSKSITVKVLPSGSSITFTSAVSKNPTNLSSDYSKTVTVTSATTDIYVMPDNCLYWYGWKSSDLEEIAPSTGWTIAYAQTYDNPTYNTYSFSMNPSAINKHIGVGSKTAIIGNPTVKAIVDCIRAYNGQYCFLSGAVNKSVDYNVDMSVATQSGMQVMSCSLTQNSENIDIFTGHTSNADCYALWYE